MGRVARPEDLLGRLALVVAVLLLEMEDGHGAAVLGREQDLLPVFRPCRRLLVGVEDDGDRSRRGRARAARPEDAPEVLLPEESLEGAVDAGGDVLDVRDELGVDGEPGEAGRPGRGLRPCPCP